METMDCLMIAASEKTERQMHFNGKIDNPTIYAGHLDLHTLDAQAARAPVYACWDFSRDISSCRIVDSGPNQLTGALINFPARAMTGANWDGTEMCWRHLPHQYGAIHFHDDDIYDFEWETDFSLVLPDDLQSGVYGIRLEQEDQHDTIPLFVCPPRRSNGLPVYVSWCRPSPTRSMVTMPDLTTNLLGSTRTRRGMPTRGIRLSTPTMVVPPTIFILIEVVSVTRAIDDHYSI